LSDVVIFGQSGLVGSEIKNQFEDAGHRIIFHSRISADLRNFELTKQFLSQSKPDIVILAAARVGGIKANNDKPVEFMSDNLLIGLNVIKAAHETGVQTLINLGSTCVYPRDCPQPIKEEYLLTGPLEKTNEAYALAKISILKLCEYYCRQYARNYITIMPTNIYGTANDNYDLETGHCFAAIFRKLLEAKLKKEKSVELWGTGLSEREFIHVSDVSKCILHLLRINYNGINGIVNVGTGTSIKIYTLAEMIQAVLKCRTIKLNFNNNGLDGTPVKVCDISKLRSLRFKPEIDLKTGIQMTYDSVKLCPRFEWSKSEWG